MRAILMTIGLTVAAAFGGAATDTYLQAAPPPVEIPSANEIPAGTSIQAALRQPVGARVNGVGDRVAVDIISPLEHEGEVVVPIGTTIHGKVTAVARPATRGNQVAVAIQFDQLSYRGEWVAIDAEIEAVELGRTGRGAGHFQFAEVMSRQDAINHTGIGDSGSVIALGTGDVEPLLGTGTRVTLRTLRRVALQ